MVFVKNAPKGYKREEVLNRAIGVKDSNGQPTRWITLDRAADFPVEQGTQQYGFDSTTVEIGRNGITVTHREDGYAEWHIDPLSGRGFTVIADTPHNMKLLAACAGDKHWRIREAEVSAEVAELEKEMLKELKSKVFQLTDNYGSPMYDDKDNPVTISAYEQLMSRRNNKRGIKSGYIFDPNKIGSADQTLALENARREKLIEELRKQNTELEAKLIAGNQKRQSLIEEGVIVEITHTREELEATKPFAALKRIAREDFKISQEDCDNMDKNTIINKIMEIQEVKKTPEIVE